MPLSLQPLERETQLTATSSEKVFLNFLLENLESLKKCFTFALTFRLKNERREGELERGDPMKNRIVLNRNI